MGFQPQNYALDFLQGMQGVNSILNSNRDRDLIEKKYDEESTLRRSAEARAAEEFKIRSENDRLDLEQKKRTAAFMEEARKVISGPPVDMSVGDLPNDPAKAPLYGNAHARVAEGLKWIGDAVTKSGRDIILTADNINELPAEVRGPAAATLEAYNVLIDPQRVGSQFVEGPTGRTYTTRHVGGVIATKQGTVVPLFYASYDDNPNEGMFVPATMDRTNADGALLEEKSMSDMVNRSTRMAKLLPAAAKAGVKTEAELKDFLTRNRDEELLAVMRQIDPVGAEKHALEVQKLRTEVAGKEKQLVSVDPTHDVYVGGNLVRKGEPKERFTQVDPTKDLIDAQGNVVRRGVPKVEPPEIKHSRTTEGGRTFDLYEIYDKGTGKLIQTRKAEYKDPLAGVEKLVLSQQVSVLKDRRNQYERQMRAAQIDLDDAINERVGEAAKLDGKYKDGPEGMGSQAIKNLLSTENRYWVQLVQARDAIAAIDQQMNVLTNMGGGQGALTGAVLGGMKRVQAPAVTTRPSAESASGDEGGVRYLDGGTVAKGRIPTRAPAATTRSGKDKVTIVQTFNGGTVAKGSDGNYYARTAQGWVPAATTKQESSQVKQVPRGTATVKDGRISVTFQ